MEKERKPMVLLVFGGMVFMTLMDAAGHYLAAKWYPYEFLLTVKGVLYVVEWVVIGFGLGLLAHGGKIKGIKISKACLIAALVAFLIGACSKKIYGIIPRSVMDWFYEMDLWTMIQRSWFLAIAGLLLFLGLAIDDETCGKRKKKMNLITCVVFLLLMFPIGQLEYKMLQIQIGQYIYVMLLVLRFLLFGIVASLTAGHGAVEMPQKADSIKIGILCLAFSLAWFFLTNWSLVFFQPELFWSGAYCTALMLAAYGGLFLTKGALAARRRTAHRRVVRETELM